MLAERLEASSVLDEETGCRIWTGGTCGPGYGKIRVEGKQRLAHRMAYEIAFGPIPDGLWVLHRCDTPGCITPDHLFLGTVTDNNADRHAKGRDAKGDRNGSRTHPERYPVGDAHYSRLHPELVPRGERHWTRKGADPLPRGEGHHLTSLHNEDVVAIRRRAAAGEVQKRLAREYRVSEKTISRIVRRETWRHV